MIVSRFYLYNLVGRVCIYGRSEAGQMCIHKHRSRLFMKGGAIMDINTITQFIGTLGFPIAACCVLFWYLQRESDNHKKEMDGMKEAINANTSIITELKLLIQQLAERIH